MTAPAPAPGPPPAPDNSARQHGQQLVVRLLALVRVGRSYQVGNQVFRRQIDDLCAVLNRIFERSPQAVLVSLSSDFYLNGVRLTVSVSNLRLHRQLREEFERRRIAGLKIEQGAQSAEIEKFFEFFLQPDTYAGTTLLEACLEAGLQRVLPAVHATTDASAAGPALESFEGGSGNGGGGGQGSGTGGAVAGASPVGPGRSRSRARGYSLAMHGAKSLLATTTLQSGMEMRHAKRVVQPLIDGAFADEPVVVGLSTLGHHDEFTYAHAVNVCLVSVTMGHALGMDRRALADLGVAALLHDVGKSAVQDQIQHPLESFDAADRAAAGRHPLEGAKLIARSTTFNLTTLRCVRAALEHHAGPGGYPALPPGWNVSRMSEIIAASDCYVSLQMNRSERGARVTPSLALAWVLGPLAWRFDPAVLWALVHSVGFYPPGQLVLLNTEATAVVIAPNKDDLARPHVRVVADPCGVPFAPVEQKVLSPLPDTMKILRPLRIEEYPMVPGEQAA